MKSQPLNISFPCIVKWFLISLLTMIGCYNSCTNEQSHSDDTILKGIPIEMRRHLVNDNDSLLTQYCRSIGYEESGGVTGKLIGRAVEYKIDNRESEMQRLWYYSERLARVMASEYYFDWPLVRISFFKNCSRREWEEYIQEGIRFRELIHESELPHEEKIAMLKRYASGGNADIHPNSVGQCYMEIADLYARDGDKKKWMQSLQVAYRVYAPRGIHTMTCQVLGVMGSLYEDFNEIDSMMICYDEAIRIAMKSKMPTQSARLHNFYAGHYDRTGRLALAHELFNRAIYLCREFKGGYSETRFLEQAMLFYADLSCWRIVARLIERSRMLASRYGEKYNTHITMMRIGMIDARMHMALGKVDYAVSIFKKLKKPMAQVPHLGEYSRFLYFWAFGLLHNDRLYEAIDIINDGIERSEAEHLPKHTLRFLLLLADAYHQLGNLEASRITISRFDGLAAECGHSMQHDIVQRDAILGSIELDEGDSLAAVSVLEAGLKRIRKYILERDASVHSYLWIERCDVLRALMHRIIRSNPKLGYGAELMWRDYYEQMGRHSHSESAEDYESDFSEFVEAKQPVLDRVRSRAGSAEDLLSRCGAIHSLFYIHDDEVWRWTASSKGTRLDVLPVRKDKIFQLAHETIQLMSEEPEGRETVCSVLLKNKLRRLAELLLPMEILQLESKDKKPLFLVTADDFIDRIPFETFDIGDSDNYIPLLLHCDVAYARNIKEKAEKSVQLPGLILVNESTSEVFGYKVPFQREIKEVLEEGKTVHAIMPDALYLAGDNATKPNLMNSWEQASLIYIAAHILRHPEIPYMVLIPLVSPPGGLGSAGSYLDIMDVRSADLRNCDIVVLSGCSSGASYVTSNITGPSLGDAFLDAGSESVVQTFWDVKDREARELMEAFIGRWDEQEYSKIRALCDVRREDIQCQNGIRHPFNWASYSIKIGKLCID